MYILYIHIYRLCVGNLVWRRRDYVTLQKYWIPFNVCRHCHRAHERSDTFLYTAVYFVLYCVCITIRMQRKRERESDDEEDTADGYSWSQKCSNKGLVTITSVAFTKLGHECPQGPTSSTPLCRFIFYFLHLDRVGKQDRRLRWHFDRGKMFRVSETMTTVVNTWEICLVGGFSTFILDLIHSFHV